MSPQESSLRSCLVVLLRAREKSRISRTRKRKTRVSISLRACDIVAEQEGEKRRKKKMKTTARKIEIAERVPLLSLSPSHQPARE